MQLGRIASKEDNFKDAEEYLKNAIFYTESYGDLIHLTHAIESYSDILYIERKYNLAIKNNLKAVKILENKLSNFDREKDKIYLRNKYFNIATCNVLIDSFHLAKNYLNKADSISYILFSKKINSHTPHYYKQFGLIATRQKQFLKAETYFKDALKIDEGKQPTNFSVTLLEELGKVAAYQKEYIKSLNYFQVGLNLLDKNCSKENYLENPSYKNIKKSDYILLLDLLIGKASTINKLVRIDRNKYFDALINIDDAINALIFVFRKDFSSTSARIGLIKKISIYLEEKITIFKQLEKTEDGVNRILSAMELNKSLVLLASFYEHQARNLAGFNRIDIQEEKRLKKQIAEIENEIQALKQAEKKNDETLVSLKDELFQLEMELKDWEQKIEKRNPKYYELKNNLKTIKIQELQNELLTNTQSFLSYFLGDSTIFAFHISSDTQEIVSIPKDFPLSDWIEKMRSGIYNHHYDASSFPYENMNEQYAIYAHLLYQKLIAPINNLKKEVIIIPDGELGYIPFDALLMEKPEKPENFATHAYFGKKHPITYNYSATLWQQMRTQKAQKGEVLTFAPKFKENPNAKMLFADATTQRRDDLWHLVYNVDEIKGITNQIGGQVYKGIGASLEKFKSLAKSASILHFATHAKLDDEDNDFSYLAFSQLDDSTEYKMYIKDLYNMHLPVQMVVLSACETGLGELKKGEGIYSLSRGFAYAGAKSIINSLWSVNDEKASELMIQFYANLSDQKTPKSIALHQAKVNYLEQCKTNEAAHPYYWAAFVPLGDMSPIELESTLFNLWKITGVLIFLILLGLFGRKYS